MTLAGLVLLQVMLQHAPSAGCQPLKLDEPVTYAHHYTDDNARPNPCKVVHNVTKPGLSNSTGYVPFIGTSISRDSQLLVTRLYHSTKDYPVKQFVVVVPERALSPPQGAMWYQLQHLKEYGDNVMIIACAHAPSVAEGWNAGERLQTLAPGGCFAVHSVGTALVLCCNSVTTTQYRVLRSHHVVCKYHSRAGQLPLFTTFTILVESACPCSRTLQRHSPFHSNSMLCQRPRLCA